jgi:hypothetical protein
MASVVRSGRLPWRVGKNWDPYAVYNHIPFLREYLWKYSTDKMARSAGHWVKKAAKLAPSYYSGKRKRFQFEKDVGVPVGPGSKRQRATDAKLAQDALKTITKTKKKLKNMRRSFGSNKVYVNKRLKQQRDWWIIRNTTPKNKSFYNYSCFMEDEKEEDVMEENVVVRIVESLRHFLMCLNAYCLLVCTIVKYVGLRS